MKSVKDTGTITELAFWLYIYGYNREASAVCDLFKNLKFNGNHTLWRNIDHAYCLKARILREQGFITESKILIKLVNQYRAPELYKNVVDWFLNTLEVNINSNIKCNQKARVRGWRLLKFECAIAYKEAGNFPISDADLEGIISDLKCLLEQEK